MTVETLKPNGPGDVWIGDVDMKAQVEDGVENKFKLVTLVQMRTTYCSEMWKLGYRYISYHKKNEKVKESEKSNKQQLEEKRY